MRPLPFAGLVGWALEEHRRYGSVFGLRAEHVFRPSRAPARDPMGHAVATLVGTAAGPHTQLAQNIVTAYLAGARFVELKTVQALDGDAIREAVAKPCINAEDEGFNCEWSTELTVGQAYAEYVHAHLAIRVLAAELGLGDGDDVAFNASVGYDLAGLREPAMVAFLDGLLDASATPA
ncbi:MAG TPA: putative selenate reductase subunit YgfK, partial [Phycicoccus sp.]